MFNVLSLIMSRSKDGSVFKRFATEYDPIKIGSIDGTDKEPHDRALIRAVNSDYVPNKQVRGDPYKTLFIGRLNPRTTQDTLKGAFSKFGTIVHCRVVKDIVTGKSKRYGFIEFESRMEADQALYGMRTEEVDRSQIIIELEAERRLRGWKPRRLGGGFGGKKESGQLRFGCIDRPFRKPINLRRNNEESNW